MTTRVLAVDTATEQCSVALKSEKGIVERVVPTAREHADLILTLTQEVLNEAKLTLRELDCLAFGRGPGSFTGVRIAVGVVQGLAFASNKPVVAVSNLAAVAQRAIIERSLGTGDRLLVCMDARMKETYWAVFEVDGLGQAAQIGDEQVTSPERVESDSVRLGAGTAFRAYPELKAKFAHIEVNDSLLPRAREILILAERQYSEGRAVVASDAQPVYVRDQVAWPAQR